MGGKKQLKDFSSRFYYSSTFRPYFHSFCHRGGTTRLQAPGSFHFYNTYTAGAMGLETRIVTECGDFNAYTPGSFQDS
jgi:hypothetical protein